jgi:predicted ATPase
MLTKISINNYKSLKQIELALNSLTVLVGPNNAGKSNLVDCFRFLYDLVTKREGAIASRGSYHHIVYNADLKEPIIINIVGVSDDYKDVGYNYELNLIGRNYGSYAITKEILSALPILKGKGGAISKIANDLMPNGRLLLEYPSKDGNKQVSITTPDGKTAGGGGGPDEKTSYLNWVKDAQRYPILGEFAQAVEKWGFYKIAPHTLTNPVQIIKQLRLNEDGSNTAAVLHIIRSEYFDAFKQIEDYLKKAVPGLEELRTEISEGAFGNTHIAIKEKGSNISIPAWNMSDGTLRFITLLTILLNPKPAPLICIEEPENHLHPGLMELLAHILKQASKKTQVLVTTHSPFLLNYLKPDNVVIITEKDGQTNVKEMSKTKGLTEALKVLGLGEVWLGNSDLGGATPVED